VTSKSESLLNVAPHSLLFSPHIKLQSFIFTLADVYLCDWSWRGKWRRERDSVVGTYPPACGMRMRWVRRNNEQRDITPRD
jgi:hypothetical protein